VWLVVSTQITTGIYGGRPSKKEKECGREREREREVVITYISLSDVTPIQLRLPDGYMVI